MFSGSHCFPVSPKNARIEDDGFPTTEGHVLESVFDLIGTPTDLDLSFITDQNAWIYMRKFRERPPANLKKLLPNITGEGHHILT